MSTKDTKTLLYYWLSLARITPLRMFKLLEIYSIEELFDRLKKDKKIEDLLGKSCFAKLVEFANLEMLEKRFDSLKELGVDFLPFCSEKFPEKLAQSNVLPPPGLYYRGDISLLSPKLNSVAIVGTRRCSHYGKEATYKFSGELVDYGFVVISGLATGIDAYAHDACLKANGKTVAVLGMGHNKFYPLDNLKLYQQICKEGLVISEYPPESEAARYTFPERNRIVSALSDAVVVIEASGKSGALITASRAIEQNKDIFALPGNITSPKSLGTNELIKSSGAHLLSCTQDILKIFDIKNAKNTKNIVAIQLDIYEQSVYNQLVVHGELPFDKLFELTKLSSGELNSVLVSLQMKDAVISLPNNTYRAAVISN